MKRVRAPHPAALTYRLLQALRCQSAAGNMAQDGRQQEKGCKRCNRCYNCLAAGCSLLCTCSAFTAGFVERTVVIWFRLMLTCLAACTQASWLLSIAWTVMTQPARSPLPPGCIPRTPWPCPAGHPQP